MIDLKKFDEEIELLRDYFGTRNLTPKDVSLLCESIQSENNFFAIYKVIIEMIKKA